MIYITMALLFLFGGAFVCLATKNQPDLTRKIGPATSVAAALLGIPSAISALCGNVQGVVTLPWSIPLGSFIIGMDALSAVFVLPILLVSALAAIYGVGYLRSFEKERDLSASWFFYNILVGSMLLVVVAKNALLFLLAWEIMSLASFFLVVFESKESAVRRAGWIYLIATHIGTAFILVLFALLGRGQGTLDFDRFVAVNPTPLFGGAIFLLALIGFGTKAGLMPMHVWLPDAHPAAPSHVSAVMSGVMIKTGIYGILRTLTLLGAPSAWWGWSLIIIGVVSGVLGIVFALAQHDVKRLLAYSSVENIGIIAIGMGIGLLGVAYDHSVIAVLGFAGSLLHVINHAVFKSMLFMGAGSIIRSTGTGEIDKLGGLMKRMPVTAIVFLVGSIAICGIPPLNGFVSEFLLYTASFFSIAGITMEPASYLTAPLIAVASLALIGGLAIACFTKAFGIIFLGEPRSSRLHEVVEIDRAMRLPMLILTGLCFAIGLSGPFLIKLILPTAAVFLSDMPSLDPHVFVFSGLLWKITFAGGGLLILIVVLMFLRNRFMEERSVDYSVTWGCGYTAPTSRMQYTSSSYSDPIVVLFWNFLRTRRRIVPPSGQFPESTHLVTETPDVYQEHFYKPIFTILEKFFSRFRWLQHGRLNLYILYIVLALLVLLGLKLR